METKQIVAALESGSLEDPKTVETMAEAARLIVAQQARIEQLIGFIEHAQVSSGVCCCGDSMDGHPSPMDCGHSPVDMWDYHSAALLEAVSDDLSALRTHDAGIWREAAAACETLLVAYDCRETDIFPDALDCKRVLMDHAAAIEKGGE